MHDLLHQTYAPFVVTVPATVFTAGWCAGYWNQGEVYRLSAHGVGALEVLIGTRS